MSEERICKSLSEGCVLYVDTYFYPDAEVCENCEKYEEKESN